MIENITNIDNKICISGKFEELFKVRDFIKENALAFGFKEDIAAQISLAVDEACTNLIRYAYLNDITRKICINIEFSADKFIISILDNGLPFNPLEIPSPEMEEYLKQFKRGGLGIHIMRSVLDKIEYYPSTDGNSYNTLKLIKMLPITN
jgi:serine/threonine-protein kinase RsbW